MSTNADTRTYTELDKDPTPKYKQKLVNIMNRLKQEKKLTEQEYRFFYPIIETLPRIYCTPKIHKEGNPLCPIVDYTGSVGYNTACGLADLLKPLFGLTPHHIKNSKDLAHELSTVHIQDGDIFNSHDVVSLFTNSPIPETLKIMEDRLRKDNKLKERTTLSVSDIM